MFQLGSTPDPSNASAGEDLPDIISLRKGVNRVVASTRKTFLVVFEGSDSRSLDGDRNLAERINQERGEMLSRRCSVLDANTNHKSLWFLRKLQEMKFLLQLLFVLRSMETLLMLVIGICLFSAVTKKNPIALMEQAGYPCLRDHSPPLLRVQLG